jgi:hypothetical protein
MTRTAIALATILLLSYPAAAQQLQKLIEQNVKASAGRLANEAGTRPPELWIHVRSATQRLEVQGKLAWFKAIQGADSFYVVQKAYKFVPSKEQETKWTGYLQSISVCDSRVPERACPKMMPR